MFAFAFYLFAITACVAGFMVVMGRNPVHSVLWLILTFVSASGLFILQGAEFVAMLLIMVYVGAVAVLFLFVVMMLDVDFAALKAEFARYLPVALLITLVILAQLAVGFGSWKFADEVEALRAVPTPEGVTNVAALGGVIYDHYLLAFQAAGLILLVAMIGAIVLTMRHRTDVKRQDVLKQMHRDPKKTLVIHNPESGRGL